MACDRIERVLQIVFYSQKAPGFAEDIPHDRKRISPYHQNVDGEVEGIFLHLSARPLI